MTSRERPAAALTTTVPTAVDSRFVPSGTGGPQELPFLFPFIEAMAHHAPMPSQSQIPGACWIGLSQVIANVLARTGFPEGPSPLPAWQCHTDCPVSSSLPSGSASLFLFLRNQQHGDQNVPTFMHLGMLFSSESRGPGPLRTEPTIH